MKYINGFIYAIGIALAFAGIYLFQTDFLTAIKLMPAGLAVMFVGWLLDEFHVEVDYEI